MKLWQKLLIPVMWVVGGGAAVCSMGAQTFPIFFGMLAGGAIVCAWAYIIREHWLAEGEKGTGAK